MCDYWVSTNVDAEETRRAVGAALAKLKNKPPIDLQIETSGSFFDDREVDPGLRTWMLQQFRALSLRYLIVETRTDKLSDAALSACVAGLRPSRLVVEFGIESLDPWVLKHCINKDTRPGSVERALDQVHRRQALATANVLVGSPFLSLSEQIHDSSRTIRGVLDMGFDCAVLFPVNVKHYTLAGWLRDRGLYQAPLLWALVDVLNDVAPELLPRVEIAWHRPRPDYHPDYTTPYAGPETCPKCYADVAALLDRWRSSAERTALAADLQSISCACRDEHEMQKRPPSQSLAERLRAQQLLIAEDLLDAPWAQEYVGTIPEHRLELL
jgi:radical SAM enzyme (TIGR01210 family)